jgi:hypothetical protein
MPLWPIDLRAARVTCMDAAGQGFGANLKANANEQKYL